MKRLITLFVSVALTAGLHASTARIPNNTPGFVRRATDIGPVDPGNVISVTVWLKLHNENNLHALVQGQYRKGSPNYHRWITQGQFNANYGPTSQQVKSVQNFLTSHGLTVLAVAENNMYIKAQAL